MAGPEPYPTKEKWTREQDEAYAEGRKSAQTSASGQPSRSGKRRRVVRTEAGARRYKVPIGAEIGSARNAKAAEAQKDDESRGRYEDFVGADPQAQARAMAGLKDNQLQRLSRVAYSFRSSDPNVVRLRVGVANELRRRGFNVTDFGGLGGGSVQPAGPSRHSISKKKIAPVRKPSPVVRNRSVMKARSKDRKLLEMSVPQLRKALTVFSRISPANRQAAARVLINRAVELSATHLLGQSVFAAANLSDERQAEVIELAGKWKHGWIPLDPTAVSIKMKGKTGGKQWWSGGKGGTSTGKKRSGVVPQGQADRKFTAKNRYHKDPERNAASVTYFRGSSTRHLQDQERAARKKTTRVGSADNRNYQHTRAELKRRGVSELPEGTLSEAQEQFIAKAGTKKKKPGVRGNLSKTLAAAREAQKRRDERQASRGRTTRPTITNKPEADKAASKAMLRRLPSTADEELRDAAGPGMDHSAIHRSTSGSWAVDNGDGSWSIFNSEGHLRTDDGSKSQLPADAWPSIHKDRTAVVRSSPKPERGSKMDNPASRNRLTQEQIAKRSSFNRTPTGGLPEVVRKSEMAEKRNTVQPNEAQEREMLGVLKARLARVGGDESRLSPKERAALVRLRDKFEGKSGKA